MTADGRPAGGRARRADGPRGVDPARDRRARPTTGVRVVLDLRPIQDPERAPLTAIYLEQLLRALDADPLDGESFSFLLAADHDDPTPRLADSTSSAAASCRPRGCCGPAPSPSTRSSSAARPVGAGWRAERGGAAGAVYHAAAGALPHRVRHPDRRRPPRPRAVGDARGLPARDRRAGSGSGSARGSSAMRRRSSCRAPRGRRGATAAPRPRDRLRVVPLAPRPAFRPGCAARPAAARDRASASGSGLPRAVRSSMPAATTRARTSPTLLDALALLARRAGPRARPPARRGRRASASWARRPTTARRPSRAAARAGVGDSLAYAPQLPPERLAALVAGARFLVQPAVSEATGLAALEAIAAGVPVVASAAGSLPEVVGPAGILVEPGDAGPPRDGARGRVGR